MTTKVFVGNLDFQTTDQALADAFNDCGKVKSGVIITRGRRSLGYGFVEFETVEAAEKAVAEKNGTELSSRPIKVELVRDPAERPTRTKEGQSATSEQRDADEGQDRTGGGGRGQRRRRFAVRRYERSNRPPPKNNNNNPGGNNTISSNSNPANQSENQKQNPRDSTGAKRRPRRRNNNRRENNQPLNAPKEKILSKTAIFVANIPFEAKDEDLKNFFKDSNPKSAHVVTTQTGRSRGYGFVDFDNEKDQQNAIQNKNKAKWNTGEKGEREISVSASHSQPKEEVPVQIAQNV